MLKFRTTGFNPTMVRLLPVACGSRGMQTELFQSHNGAIAAEVAKEAAAEAAEVSIPQWCDCCQGH